MTGTDTALIVLQAASWTPGLPFHGTWTGLTFLTDDLDDTFRNLSRRGASFDSPPALQPWGGKVAIFADIDGNRLGLVELPRSRGQQPAGQ